LSPHFSKLDKPAIFIIPPFFLRSTTGKEPAHQAPKDDDFCQSFSQTDFCSKTGGFCEGIFFKFSYTFAVSFI